MAQSQLEEWKLVNEAVPPADRLPPLPAAWLDDATSPPLRLEAGLGYARSSSNRQGPEICLGDGSLVRSKNPSLLEVLATLAHESGYPALDARSPH